MKMTTLSTIINLSSCPRKDLTGKEEKTSFFSRKKKKKMAKNFGAKFIIFVLFSVVVVDQISAMSLRRRHFGGEEDFIVIIWRSTIRKLIFRSDTEDFLLICYGWSSDRCHLYTKSIKNCRYWVIKIWRCGWFHCEVLTIGLSQWYVN